MTSHDSTFAIDVDGVTLRARRIDTGAAPDRAHLVFLHEALGSIAQWKHFPDELCRAVRCNGLVYERQGHGRSDALTAPRDMHFYTHEAATVLPAVLAATDITRYVLVGHSDGATIALKHAGMFPDAPRAVISIAAHVMIEEVTLDGIRAARTAWQTTDLRAKLRRYHGANTEAMFAAWADTWLRPASRDWNMYDDLARITCPLQLMQGDRDAYGSDAQLEAIRSRCRGVCEVDVLEGIGHVPMIEARGETIARCGRFLAAHAGMHA